MVTNIMQAKCKRELIIAHHPSYSKINATYYVDKWYDYYIEKHEETGTLLYYVDGQPMLEGRFKKHFIDISQIRDQKIEEILYI